MEWRKHTDQMTSMERQRLTDLVLQNTKYILTEHAKRKQNERDIDNIEIGRCIKFGNIIEFHFVNDSKRILMRKNNTVKDYNICVVIDIETHEIITTYKNSCGDNHRSIDMTNYNGSYDLLSYLN